MARKRAPGGGRAPHGEFPGKSVTFATRLQPETRQALDDAAKKSGRSVSAMAERLLKAGLNKPQGSPQNTALAWAVGQIAERIENETRKSWRDDAYTGMALLHATEILLVRLVAGTKTDPPVPSAIEKAASKMPPEFAERFRKPAGLGQLLAYNLILEIETAPVTQEPNEWSLPIFLYGTSTSAVGLVAKNLGLARGARRRVT